MRFNQAPIFGSLPSSALPIRKGLVLDVPMLINRDLQDYSGYNNPGTNTGATWVLGADGKSALAVPTSAVTIPFGVADDVELTQTSCETFILNVTRTAATGNNFCGFYLDDTSSDYWIFNVTNAGGTTQMRANGDTFPIINFPAALPLNKPTHLASVKIGDELHLYIDGALVGSDTGTGLTASIGATNFDMGFAIDAVFGFGNTINYFQVYNRALTASEIRSLYLNPWQAWKKSNTAYWQSTLAAPPAAGLAGIYYRTLLQGVA
jgi:hypothetical protein